MFGYINIRCKRKFSYIQKTSGTFQVSARWFVKHQKALCTDNITSKNIEVMIPKDSGEFLIPTNVFESLNIDSFSESTKAKVFIGLRVSTDYYMPYYSPYDTLLIANDRKPLKNEHCVILYYGKIKIVTRFVRKENDKKIVDNVPIQNRKNRISEHEIDELIGYVADVHKNFSN